MQKDKFSEKKEGEEEEEEEEREEEGEEEDGEDENEEEEEEEEDEEEKRKKEEEEEEEEEDGITKEVLKTLCEYDVEFEADDGKTDVENEMEERRLQAIQKEDSGKGWTNKANDFTRDFFLQGDPKMTNTEDHFGGGKDDLRGHLSGSVVLDRHRFVLFLLFFSFPLFSLSLQVKEHKNTSPM